MKVIRKNREFFVYRTDGKLLFKFERGGQGAWPDNGLVVKLVLGNGAGYKRGATAFFAFNSSSHTRWPGPNWFTKLTKLEFGITRNANIVPYLSH